MNSDECPDLKISKSLLKCFGLWPYQSTFTKRCNYLIFITWTMISVTPMIQGFVEKTDVNVVVVVETIIGSAWAFGTLAQVTMLYMRPSWLIRLYGQIENDRQGITDSEDLEILYKFSEQGTSLTLVYIGTSIVSYSCFLVLMYAPLFFNSNVTHDIFNTFPYYSRNWIINDDLQRLQVIVHMCLEMFYGGLIYVTVISMYMCSVNHTCGMYAIVSHRLQKLVKSSGILLPKKTRSDYFIIPALLDIIDKHRAAIKSAHIVGRTFSRTFFGVQIGILICLALIIFDLSFNIKNTYLTLRVLFIGVIFIEHAFYMNYGGQQIIEFSNKVFTSTYFINWNSMSTKSRKILLMIILRSSKSKTLTAGAMTLSLQNFTTIMKASWSLATALLSTQNSHSVTY